MNLPLLLLSGASLAQSSFSMGEAPALNAQTFRPALDARTFLRTTDTGLLRDRSLFSAALLQYAYRPLVYFPYDYDETHESEVIVGGLAEMDLVGGATWGPVRAGLLAPIYLRGTSPESGETGFGDLLADIKVRALDRDEKPVGLAFSGRIGVPTATTSLPLGSDGLFYELEADLDVPMGHGLLAFNLGQRGQPRVVLDRATWGSQLYANLGGSFEITPRSGTALELTTSFTEADFGNLAVMPIEALASGWHRLGTSSPLVLHGGMGYGITNAVSTPACRVIMGIAWDPRGKRDTDLDGIVDKLDACASEPEDIDAWEDTDGCPEATRVTLKAVDPGGKPVEGATITIDDGAAPSELSPGTHRVKATATNYVNADTSIEIPKGPPVERTVTLTPYGKVKIRILDESGRPVEAAVQLSGTEISREAVAVSTLERSWPPTSVHVEARSEGFAPYEMDLVVEAGGSQEIEIRLKAARAVVTAERIEISDSVYFDVGKDTIQPVSFELLDEVAGLLQEHPELRSIRVEGHTDSRGPAAANLALSKRRAAAVMRYLISKGIAEERLESEGYGESRPLTAAENEMAWSMNRRVDFFIVQRSD